MDVCAWTGGSIKVHCYRPSLDLDCVVEVLFVGLSTGEWLFPSLAKHHWTYCRLSVCFL
jgi:hypothetical protein